MPERVARAPARPLAVVITDGEGRITSWNDGAEQVYGYAAGEVVGRRGVTLLSPRAPHPVSGEGLEEFRRGEPWLGQMWVRRKDGEDVLVDVADQPLLAVDGTLLGAVAVVRPASGHGPSPGDTFDAILLADHDGGFSFASPRFCAVFGYQPERLPARLVDLVHPDDQPLFSAIAAAVRAGQPLPSPWLRLRIRAGTGEWRWVEGSAPTLVTDGETSRVLVVVREVAELVENEQRARHLASIVEASPDAIVRCDTASGAISYWSPGAEALYGWTASQAVGRSVFDLYVPAERAHEARLALDEAAQGRVSFRSHTQRRRADGTLVDVSVALAPVRDSSGNVVAATSIMRDVSQVVRAQQALAESEARYRLIVETAQEAILLLDQDSLVAFGNPQAERLFGALTGTNRHMLDLVPPELQDFMRERLHRRRAGTAENYEIQVPDVEGRLHALYVSAAPLCDDDGGFRGSVAMLTDISGRKQAERALSELALTDTLTGLANRTLLQDRLRHAVQRRGAAYLAVLLLDLDNFKAVNDSMGHGVGDELLCETGRRICAAVRPHDTVARAGGDEFVVVCEELAEAEEALAVANRVLAAVHQPVRVSGVRLTPTASIGVAISDGRSDPDALLRDADTAMYQAKDDGGARTALFHPEQHRTAVERLQILSALPQAVARGELVLHYQPVVATRAGAVVGVEALVRWNHPERGLLLPLHFVPLAERTGLILELGDWVLVEAMRQSAAWARSAPHLAHVAVNLSARQLSDPYLLERVVRGLETTGAAPRDITVEITESALVSDADTAIKTLQALSELGVKVSIDDFGTGYSSLVYLREFPVNEIKIDRTFVHGVVDNPQDRTIVASLVQLAHAFDAHTTAEGVECPAQWAELVGLRCERAQGYYFARPAPADQVQRIVPRFDVDGRAQEAS